MGSKRSNLNFRVKTPKKCHVFVVASKNCKTAEFAVGSEVLLLCKRSSWTMGEVLNIELRPKKRAFTTSWLPSSKKVFPKIGVKTPKWMVKIMENPYLKWMLWGENPLFSDFHPYHSWQVAAGPTPWVGSTLPGAEEHRPLEESPHYGKLGGGWVKLVKLVGSQGKW